jgi:cobalt-zinc-cadmium efflux system membrane fusion protein
MLRRLRVAPVELRELPTEEVTAPGKVEANPNRIAHVGLPVPGRVMNVLVQLGDVVTQGQPVLTIESPDAGEALSASLQAESSVTQAKAAWEKAQVDLTRLRDLYEHDAAAKKEVLDAQNVLTQAKAVLEQAQAARAQTLRRLEILGLKPNAIQPYVTVHAPLPGKVLEINIVPGEYRTDTAATVLTIADLRTVWISSDVPENAIRLIQPGEQCEVHLIAYPGETFTGRVSRIADTVDLQTRTIKVWAELENPQGRFRPGMFVSIRHIEAIQPVPVVPVGAVMQGNSHTTVFVERSPGQFQETPVTVGKRIGDSIPILTGVQAGERVVIDGLMLLKSPSLRAPDGDRRSRADSAPSLLTMRSYA